MIANTKLRVMWLLNHTTARKFEISMLKKIGVEEIFLPKLFPQDQSFRTASVDWSEDQYLSIPSAHLDLLNKINWYEGVSADVWKVVNLYFNVIFLLPMNEPALSGVCRYFDGVVVWRVYGRDKSANYDRVLNDAITRGHVGGRLIRSLGSRFYFGEAYPHIADIEPEYLKSRRLYLPLGLNNANSDDRWKGNNPVVYFVCPEIATSKIYGDIYEEFKKNFGEFPFIVAGAQPIEVLDDRVLGYVSDAQHEYNMTQSRVMFYHSREPNHIHYHPFEAVRAGMPLVFMSGGMLDRMGGLKLPGRCENFDDARKKIRRIINGDRNLIEKIRVSQAILLDSMRPDNCEPAWRAAYLKIQKELVALQARKIEQPKANRTARIAVIVPVEHLGGRLRSAMLLAEALYHGSRQSGEDAEIVFALLDDDDIYDENSLSELPLEISRRKYKWKVMSSSEARRAMRYSDFQGWEPLHEFYITPDDGIHQFLDCDLWIIMGDRVSYPILPLRPFVLHVHDYRQRYASRSEDGFDDRFLNAARQANKVFVEYELTRQDALQYVGLDPRKVSKLPMLTPRIPVVQPDLENKKNDGNYFVMDFGEVPFDSYGFAAQVLDVYYHELQGGLNCRVLGVGYDELMSSGLPSLKMFVRLFGGKNRLRKCVKWVGPSSISRRRELISRAAFLWHLDDFSSDRCGILDAASMNVPLICNDHPLMREINGRFKLNLIWMNSRSPREMAIQIKRMEQNKCEFLMDANAVRDYGPEYYSSAYWQEVRSCL